MELAIRQFKLLRKILFSFKNKHCKKLKNQKGIFTISLEKRLEILFSKIKKR